VISRSRYYLTPNNSKIVQDTAIVTMGYQEKGSRIWSSYRTAPFSMTSNDP